MVDLILRVEGAGAGDDIIPAGQRLGADLFQQKAGGRAVLVPKDHRPVGQSPDGAAVIDRSLGGDGRQEPDLFAARPAFPGQEPGAQPFDIAAHLFKVGAAGFGPPAVQQQAPCRGDVAGGAAAQGGVLGKEVPHLLSAGAQRLGRNGVVQADHHLVRAGGQRLQGVGRGGVQDGGIFIAKDHPVQTVRVAGTVDALDRPCRKLGQLFHHGGFAAAGPALDEIELHPGLLPQLPEIALEPGRGGGAEKEIDGLRRLYFHSRTPRFWHKVCKSEAECHKNGRKEWLKDKCAGTLRRFCPAGRQNPQRRRVCSGAAAAGPPGGRCP